MDAGSRNYRYSSKLSLWKYGSCQHSKDCGNACSLPVVTTMTLEETKRFPITAVFMKFLFLDRWSHTAKGLSALKVPTLPAATVRDSLAKEHR